MTRRGAAHPTIRTASKHERIVQLNKGTSHSMIRADEYFVPGIGIANAERHWLPLSTDAARHASGG